MAQLVAEQVQEGANVDGARGRLKGCTFDQFNRQHPLVYNGKGDAVLAENWLLERLEEARLEIEEMRARQMEYEELMVKRPEME
ncbi:hypothetical protein CJ030_MR0G003385 [Morella rubra]|uniref:Uncharacterized protein n=1 Tax=Morella rubra TaxID=262757 RepID=A0A6A1UNZ9_9ROSI|nr:hypothetical protein CJ030_MR0G003385 [Morella rubra]